MQKRNVGAFLFLLLLALLAAAGWWVGIWSDLKPELFSSDGPAGLSRDFAINLVSEGIAVLTQIVVVFLIFDFVVNRRARRYSAESRRLFAHRFVSVLVEVTEKITNLAGIAPGMDSARHRVKELRVGQLLSYYDRNLDVFEERAIRDANELFDKLVFERDSDALDDLEDAMQDLLKEMLPDPGRLRLLRFLRLRRKPPDWYEQWASTLKAFAERKLLVRAA